MASNTLKLSPRQQTGSAACRRLRAQGLLPAIIYGHGQTPLNISVAEHDLKLLLVRGARVFDVLLDGKTEKVLIKDVQYDHLNVNLVHADLVRVSLNETITLTIPIELRGSMEASSHGGGVVEQYISQVEVECLASNIPDGIRLQIGKLTVGDSIRVKDLPAMPGVKILSDPEAVVVAVRIMAEEVPAVAAPEAAEAAAAEPEIVGRRVAEEPAEEKGEGKEKEKDKGK